MVEITISYVFFSIVPANSFQPKDILLRHAISIAKRTDRYMSVYWKYYWSTGNPALLISFTTDCAYKINLQFSLQNQPEPVIAFVGESLENVE